MASWPDVDPTQRDDMADEQYLTPAQVAEEMHVTVVTVRRWINMGALRAQKAGPRKWMIRRADVANFLSSGGRGQALSDASEDPSFRRYLVVPREY